MSKIHHLRRVVFSKIFNLVNNIDKTTCDFLIVYCPKLSIDLISCRFLTLQGKFRKMFNFQADDVIIKNRNVRFISSVSWNFEVEIKEYCRRLCWFRTNKKMQKWVFRACFPSICLWISNSSMKCYRRIRRVRPLRLWKRQNSMLESK